MSIQALREQLSQENRAAKALLAEKGSIPWTADDQKKFDGHMEVAERLQAQIDAHQKLLDDDAQANFKDVKKKDGKDQPEAFKALEVFLRKKPEQMTAEERVLIQNTMSTTTGSEGGNTVQPMIASRLIDLMKAYAFMRAVADQVSTDSGVDMSFPTSDGTSEVGEWVAQNASATAADPTFGTRAVNVFKAGSKVVAVPIELLQDSQLDIAGMVLNRLGQRIGRLSNAGYTTGTGSGQPFGFVAVASTGKTGTTGQTLTIIYDDLVDLVDSLDVAYLQGANEPKFMMSQTMRRVVRKIKDTSGRPIWTPSYEGGMSVGSSDRLLGYPVAINNDMAVPAANAKSLAFGDFNKYLIRDAMQVTLFRFDDSAYMSKGQIGFLAWARTGGNLLDLNAVKVYAHSAT
jgi:HK97 family phage major capsid protein